MSALRRLRVFLSGQAVGTLAEAADHRIYFEYEAAWLAGGFSISPYHLPLTPGLKQESTRVFEGLPGVFDDSLPDGWGRLLTDRYFQKRGVSPGKLSPLDRLAFIGRHGMGALEYQPEDPDAVSGPFAIELTDLARQSERIVRGSAEEMLPALRVAGGSSGGSRPKVFVGFNPQTQEMRSDILDLPDGFEHWLVKFRAKEDPKDAGAIELAYARMAERAGIAMPMVRLFETKAGNFFGVRRFDWLGGGVKRHAHSFGGLIHSSFRVPNRDYRELLSITMDLTKDHRQLEQAFRRAVFNVLTHNRDDHVKNFAFEFDPGSLWRLSPAFDLTWSEGMRGEHNMTVMGKGRPAAGDLLRLAKESGIVRRAADSILEQIREAVAQWPKLAKESGVGARSIGRIGKTMMGRGAKA